MDILDLLHIDVVTVVIGISAFILAYMAIPRENKKYNVPPGPRPMPIIGSLYYNLLRRDRATELRKRYGDIAMYYIGSKRTVFLNSYEAVKDSTSNNICSDRHRMGKQIFSGRYINPEKRGIISTNFHQQLRKNRSVSLTIFRDLGVGRSTMEEKILEQAELLIENIQNKNGGAFDPWHIFTCAVTNVIFSAVLNKTFAYNDQEFEDVMESTDKAFASLFYVRSVDAVNWLRFIPPFKDGFWNVVDADQKIVKFMQKYSKLCIDQFQNEELTNFVEGWLNKHFDETIQKPIFDQDDFDYIMRDFLIAGSETSTTSLKWTVIQLANRPDIQAKLHEEMDTNIGRDRPIRLADRAKLAYLEAFIWEIQRFFTVLPFSVPHFTLEHIKIGKYDIPANTDIILNLHAVHMDENYFENPDVFRPERFIDSTGKFVKHPHVIPFGIGKRSCLGELLAKQELFLFTASLLQHFEFRPPHGEDKIDDQGVVSFTYIPRRFNVRAIPR